MRSAHSLLLVCKASSTKGTDDPTCKRAAYVCFGVKFRTFAEALETWRVPREEVGAHEAAAAGDALS